MPSADLPDRGATTFLYIPYVDEQGTGMQRFGSEMILALLRAGVEGRVLVGQLEGRPAWLDKVPHKVIIGKGLSRLLPRPLAAAARMLWIQFALPLTAGRGATLVTLADRDLAILPMMRQIAVAHDLTQAKSLRQLRGVARDIRNWLWRIGLKRSARVIAISGATKADLIETFEIPAEKIDVVHEGYDPAIFHPAEAEAQSGRPYLLYAGTLAPNKNIPFLLNAYVELRKGGVDTDLRLVGRYDATLAGDLLLSVPTEFRSDVDFAGFVTDEELAEQMRGCRAFVFPSLSEGFGLAPVEAMACGAPVISSEATSLTEVVGYGGVLLSPTDLERWVAEMTRVVLDDRYRAELSQRAERRSADYSWDHAAQAYARLLAAV